MNIHEENTPRDVNIPDWFLGEIEDVIDTCNNLLQNPSVRNLTPNFLELIKAIPHRLFQQGYLHA
jgi:hypothetical protein